MQKLNINLDHITKGLAIEIFATKPNTIFFASDAIENHEAEYQIIEGNFYQYKLNKANFRLHNIGKVVETSHFNESEGRISPNFYVGTLSIPIYEGELEKGIFYLEVRSVKTSYRKDYRFMLESITKYASDLILQTNSPVNQTFEVDHREISKTLYQRFCFVKSIIDTEEFHIAIQQIIKSPVTTWATKTESRDVRSLKKLNSKDVRNLIHSKNRMYIPKNHRLRGVGINSLALKTPTTTKEESVDTPENKFIKYALESFLFFCEEIQLKSKNGSRLFQEAQTTSNKIQSFLQYNLFKEVSRLTNIDLNSPVLQKKAGYREVLKTWLMFDLAAKLIWEGGEDVYSVGNKHVAKLYEYWLFFKLLDTIKSVFNIDSDEYKKLIRPTKNFLSLQLKEGKQIALNGTYSSTGRDLAIQFSYNKTFGKNSELSKEGSWTLNMLPDYTLSIWPKELEMEKAESSEQIVHIHFDAKYKVKDKEKNSDFKEIDIFKMHAYKDAIRRTGGAYILYPGIDNEPTTFKGFHEVLPGLGAFAIRPSEDNSGINHLINFINEVKNHFLNRATQRENISAKRYQITKGGLSTKLMERVPEFLNGKKLIPSEVFVLVGYYKDKAHLDWIREKSLYNVRYGGEKYELNAKEIGAKYLLLYSVGQTESTLFFRLGLSGPKFYSKNELKEDLEYKSEPSQEMYLVYQVDQVIEKEFEGRQWILPSNPHSYSRPYSVSLLELFNEQKQENGN